MRLTLGAAADRPVHQVPVPVIHQEVPVRSVGPLALGPRPASPALTRGIPAHDRARALAPRAGPGAIRALPVDTDEPGRTLLAVCAGVAECALRAIGASPTGRAGAGGAGAQGNVGLARAVAAALGA